jgi:hypothetical protein
MEALHGMPDYAPAVGQKRKAGFCFVEDRSFTAKRALNDAMWEDRRSQASSAVSLASETAMRGSPRPEGGNGAEASPVSPFSFVSARTAEEERLEHIRAARCAYFDSREGLDSAMDMECMEL